MIFATVIISLNSLSFSSINIYSHVFKFLVLQIATVFLSVDCSVGSYVHVFWSCGIWVYNTYLDLILTTVNPGTEDSNSQLSHQSHFHGSTMSHETWLQSLQADIYGFGPTPGHGPYLTSLSEPTIAVTPSQPGLLIPYLPRSTLFLF